MAMMAHKPNNPPTQTGLSSEELGEAILDELRKANMTDLGATPVDGSPKAKGKAALQQPKTVPLLQPRQARMAAAAPADSEREPAGTGPQPRAADKNTASAVAAKANAKPKGSGSAIA